MTQSTLWIAALLYVAALVAPPPAAAAAGTIQTFALPTAYAFPASITTGSDGALWFTETGKIGRITTAGVLKEFALPGGHTGASITPGWDGALWFTEPGSSIVGRISTAGAITEFSVPGACQAGYSCPTIPKPQGVVSGPDGALWFTEAVFSRVSVRTTASKIDRMTTTGTFTETAIPGGTTRRTTPTAGAIVAGSDGALWFTDANLGKIWRSTTAGVLSQFQVPVGGPGAITQGPDGALWFTASGGQLGRITTAGAITEKTVPSGPNGTSLGAIATGADGNLWFAQYDLTQSAGRITRSTPSGAMTNFAFPTYNEIDGITRGPDAAMWFTTSNNQTGVAKIGRITTK